MSASIQYSLYIQLPKLHRLAQFQTRVVRKSQQCQLNASPILWQAVCSKIQSLNIYAILQYFHSIQSLLFSFNPIHQYFYSIQSRNIDSIQSLKFFIQSNPEKLIQSSWGERGHWNSHATRSSVLIGDMRSH